MRKDNLKLGMQGLASPLPHDLFGGRKVRASESPSAKIIMPNHPEKA
jgi:hypothetical protein